MLKLMIVDDEELEREGLKRSVNWKALGIDVVGVFENGKVAYEAIEQSAPDILLTDIRMPFMDGLTLAEKVHVLSPQTKIIFLTGYEDFGYAKRAIEINATQYVLKPYEIDEILKVLQETAQQFTKEQSIAYEQEMLRVKLKESLPLLKEKFCSDLLQGFYQTIDIEKVKNRLELFEIPLLSEGEYFVNIISVENYNQLVNDTEECYQQMLTLALHEFIENTVKDYYGVCVNVSESMFAVILSFENQSQNSQKNYQYIDTLIENLSEQYKAIITAGIGKPCHDISSVHIVYRQAQEALHHKFTFGTNQSIYFGDINRQDTVEMDIFLDNSKNHLLTLVEQGSDTEIEQQIGLMFQCMSKNGADKSYIQNLCIDIINKISKYLLGSGIDIDQIFGDGTSLIGKLLRFDTIHDTQMWMKNIIIMICRHLQQQKNTRNLKIVEQMKAIIEKRYAEDITVADIASEVYLSAGYATMLFKKETGESIMRYIIKTRINNAKQMLEDPNSKISEVSYNIGYSNLAYFTTLFKNEMGISPKDYRDRCCK